jgi:kinesin family protein 2/24
MENKQLSSSFDPTEWAEKRRQAMARASELRQQRRTAALPVKAEVRVVRAQSRESVSTQGGDREALPIRKKWEIDTKPKVDTGRVRMAESSRVRAVTSPAEKRLAAGVKSVTSKVKTGLGETNVSQRPVSATTRTARTTTGVEPIMQRLPRASVRQAEVGPKRPATSTDFAIQRSQARPLTSTSSQEARPISKPSTQDNSRRENVLRPSSNDPVTRQMIDRDTLRRENGVMFSKAIAYWRSKQVVSEDSVSSRDMSRVSVFVRKRPLFEQERFNLKEFDVVSVLGHREMVVHNCQFQADLKTPFLTHSRFNAFTRCFPDTASNDEIFFASTDPLVSHALSGGISTVFCFGQTGSGKTYTMTSIQEMVSKRLDGNAVSVQFLELCGKKVLDLLNEEKSLVRLREGNDGRLVLDGASNLTVSSSTELIAVMEKAQERRNTESTGANAVSSRSHVVGILTLPGSGGKLLLVDLAGSERRKDSMWHDKDRQREGAEINASIHALKECIRMVTGKSGSGGSGSAFRLSTLTRILAESFVNPEAKLAVVATVSPCATDVEHTVSTLKTVLQLTGTPEGMSEQKQTEMYPPSTRKLDIHPKKWSPGEVQDWLVNEGETDCVAISKSTTGAMLVRMSESRFVQACGDDEKRGNKLFRSLHGLIAGHSR